jgi:predicted phosphoribosyltransferase
MFKNRKQAGAQLAEAIARERLREPVVLGIPRGGVVLAAEVAKRLDCELDVILVRKIGMPEDPERALGAVDEKGDVIWNLPPNHEDLPKGYAQEALKRELALLRQRRDMYEPGHSLPSWHDRPVVVVDDGIATGATMMTALRLVRKQRPAELIVAAAVAPSDMARQLGTIADRVILLASPERFTAVGDHFEDFRPVADDEVAAILKAARRHTSHA